MACRFIWLALSLLLTIYYSCNNIRSVAVGGFPLHVWIRSFDLYFQWRNVVLAIHYLLLPSARRICMCADSNQRRSCEVPSCPFADTPQRGNVQIFVRNLHLTIESARADGKQTRLTAKRLIKRNELLFSIKWFYFIVLTFLRFVCRLAWNKRRLRMTAQYAERWTYDAQPRKKNYMATVSDGSFMINFIQFFVCRSSSFSFIASPFTI